MNNYPASEQVRIFSNVDIFIFAFDVNSQEIEEDLRCYQSFLKTVNEISSSANVYCLLHLQGSLQNDDMDKVFLNKIILYTIYDNHYF